MPSIMNKKSKTREYIPDIDDDGSLCEFCGEVFEVCECRIGEECGRWNNGRLMPYCAKAGSEECDFECPYS